MQRILARSTCCLLWCASLGSLAAVSATEWEGFTAPYRSIQVASDETGTIDEVYVREGQSVQAGQPLVRLNSVIFEALRAVAQQHVHAEGRLEAAQADLQMRQQRLAKLETLRLEGHARQEEVDRASVELAVAAANFRVVQEERINRQLELDKIQAQIDRRTIRAPIDGVITKLHKDVGEYVAPNQADVLTLVQIETLLANFTLLGDQAARLQTGQKLAVQFLVGGSAPGIVEFISPINDAESGTALVKIRLENSDSRLRSGQRCKIRLAE